MCHGVTFRVYHCNRRGGGELEGIQKNKKGEGRLNSVWSFEKRMDREAGFKIWGPGGPGGNGKKSHR